MYQCYITIYCLLQQIILKKPIFNSSEILWGGPVREIGIGGFNLSDENIKQLILFETMLEDNKQVSKQEAL